MKRSTMFHSNWKGDFNVFKQKGYQEKVLER